MNLQPVCYLDVDFPFYKKLANFRLDFDDLGSSLRRPVMHVSAMHPLSSQTDLSQFIHVGLRLPKGRLQITKSHSLNLVFKLNNFLGQGHLHLAQCHNDKILDMALRQYWERGLDKMCFSVSRLLPGNLSRVSELLIQENQDSLQGAHQ